jgi:hypothetical protein
MHWAYFTQISNESQNFTQMVIFLHIEHILHNYFSTFHCGLGFLKFLTFSWWSLSKYGASLPDGILGFIIEVTKGGISSNWSNSSSSMTLLTPTIHHFPRSVTPPFLDLPSNKLLPDACPMICLTSHHHSRGRSGRGDQCGSAPSAPAGWAGWPFQPWARLGLSVLARKGGAGHRALGPRTWAELDPIAEKIIYFFHFH